MSVSPTKMPAALNLEMAMITEAHDKKETIEEYSISNNSSVRLS
jgi:hypothetical protein